MCSIPSLIYIFFINDKNNKSLENRFYYILSYFNIFLIIPSIVLNITVIFDRLLMFSLPFQAIIYSKFLDKLKNQFFKTYFKISLVLSFFCYTFIILLLNQDIELWFYRLYYDIYDINLDYTNI